jgi:hypothetical protein
MIPHRCPACQTMKEYPDINDDSRVDPPFRLDELVQIKGRGLAMYRIMKMQGMTMELEKLP